MKLTVDRAALADAAAWVAQVVAKNAPRREQGWSE